MNDPANTTSIPDDTGGDLLSVGKVAEETNLSVDMLRIWERRYGRPKPVRLSSGHRRYTPDQVLWLRMVAEGLSRGFRPGKLLTLSEEDLSNLLDTQMAQVGADLDDLTSSLDDILSYRARPLTRTLHSHSKKLPAVIFLETKVVPLLWEIGRRWRHGKLAVSHEHFAVQIVKDVLRGLRQRLTNDPRKQPEDPSATPQVILTTLPGETHDLGTLMAAIVCENARIPSLLLGAETPAKVLATTAKSLEVRAVGISVSLAKRGVETDRMLIDLRRILPPSILLIVGGQGAPQGRRRPRGVVSLPTLSEFDRWLRGGTWAPTKLANAKMS